jgi:hypothetical protein
MWVVGAVIADRVGAILIGFGRCARITAVAIAVFEPDQFHPLRDEGCALLALRAGEHTLRGSAPHAFELAEDNLQS